MIYMLAGCSVCIYEIQGEPLNMKQYKIEITDKALADMEEIYNYIAIQLQAPENAMGQYNRIAKAIEELNRFAEKV